MEWAVITNIVIAAISIFVFCIKFILDYIDKGE